MSRLKYFSDIFFFMLKVSYKGILVYEILMDCVARKKYRKLLPIILNGFQDIVI